MASILARRLSSLNPRSFSVARLVPKKLSAKRTLATTSVRYAVPAENPESVAAEVSVNVLPEASDNVNTDWSTSFSGLSTQAFPKEVAEILLAPIDPLDVEMKPGEFYA